MILLRRRKLDGMSEANAKDNVIILAHCNANKNINNSNGRRYAPPLLFPSP